MTTDKKNLLEIRIINYDGDLSKKWYIEWFEGKKRIQKRQGINRHNTVEDRMKAAEKLKDFWLLKLIKLGKTVSNAKFDEQYNLIENYFNQAMMRCKIIGN